MKEVAIFRHQPAKFDNPAPTLQKRERAHQKHKELHPLTFANSFVGFLSSPSSYHEGEGDKGNGYTCCAADVLFVSFSKVFWRWSVLCIPLGFRSWICWCHSHQERWATTLLWATIFQKSCPCLLTNLFSRISLLNVCTPLTIPWWPCTFHGILGVGYFRFYCI